MTAPLRRYLIDAVCLISLPLAVTACVLVFSKEGYYGRLANGQDWTDFHYMGLNNETEYVVKFNALKIVRETMLMIGNQPWSGPNESLGECAYFIDELYQETTRCELPVFYAVKIYDMTHGDREDPEINTCTKKTLDDLRRKALIK